MKKLLIEFKMKLSNKKSQIILKSKWKIIMIVMM